MGGDNKNSIKSRFGSVEPSPAALVRAAFDLFESCCLNTYTKKEKTTRWVVFFLVETTGLEPVTSCV